MAVRPRLSHVFGARGIVACAAMAVCAGMLIAGRAYAAGTVYVSVASDGTQANGMCEMPSVSADGRYVAFASTATNLVPGDTNGKQDIFIRDVVAGTTECVSLAPDGSPGNGNSTFPVLSTDGRYVAFTSNSSNLVLGVSYGVFVHDRVSGTTECVSVASDGTPGNAQSGMASMSADGRYIVFITSATNLVPGQTHGAPDAYVHDRVTGTTERASVASDSAQTPASTNWAAISDDGRYVAFDSFDDFVVTGDTNTMSDVFVRDRQAGTTTRVSMSTSGVQGNSGSSRPSISADGHLVAFQSGASNFGPDAPGGYLDVFVHDCLTGSTELSSAASDGTPGDYASDYPSISGDGRCIVFNSGASNLGPLGRLDYEAYLRDRRAGTTECMSIADDGHVLGAAYWLSVSPNGRFIAFEAAMDQVYLRDRQTGASVTATDASGRVGQTVTLSATLVPLAGAGVLKAEDVRFTVDGDTAGTAVTDANGIASLAYIIPAGAGAGTRTVTAEHDESGRYADAGGTAKLTVAKGATALSLCAAAGTAGQSVQVRTLLLCGGHPVIGRTVRFAVDGTPAGSAVSDASGAALAWTIPTGMSLGLHNVTASFGGDSAYYPTTRTTAALTVVTVVAFSLFPVSGPPDQTVTLRSLFYATGHPIVGKTVKWYVDATCVGSSISGATDVSLDYRIPWSMNAGTHNVTVKFAGDNAYAPASRTTAALTVLPPKANVSFSIYPVQGEAGHTVTLKAMVYSGGASLIGKTITFAVDGTPVGSATSDASGAACSYTIPALMTNGLHDVTVSFAGDATHMAATRTTAALTVGKQKAIVTFSIYAVDGQPGETVILDTIVYSGGAPAPGLEIQFAVDGVPVGTAISFASWAMVPYTIPASMAVGVHSVTVSFAGDASRLASSSTTAALTVK